MIGVMSVVLVDVDGALGVHGTNTPASAVTTAAKIIHCIFCDSTVHLSDFELSITVPNFFVETWQGMVKKKPIIELGTVEKRLF